jgi:hypothetical protein
MKNIDSQNQCIYDELKNILYVMLWLGTHRADGHEGWVIIRGTDGVSL